MRFSCADWTTFRPVLGGWSVGAADDVLGEPAGGTFAGAAREPLEAAPAEVAGVLPAPSEAEVLDATADENCVADDDDDELECPPTRTTIATTTAAVVANAPPACQNHLDERRRRLTAAGAGTGLNRRATRASIDRANSGAAAGRSADSEQRDLGQVGVAGVDRLAGEHRVDRVEGRGDFGIDRFVVVKQSHCRPS